MRIVIFTKKYGTDVSGATLATHTLANIWATYPDVGEIVVITKALFSHSDNDKIRILKYGSLLDAYHLVRENQAVDTVFYSDDHLGFLLSCFSVSYVHTYHGNWPDAMWLSPRFFFYSLVFIPLYALTVNRACYVINVSRYMQRRFTDKFNKKSMIIRNGVASSKAHRVARGSVNERCCMIGSVCQRKYGKLMELDKQLLENNIKLGIDIYGGVTDKELAEKLQTFSNIHLKGFVDFNNIDVSEYDFFLSTSTQENMPISVIEALKAHLPVITFGVGGVSEAVDDTCGCIINNCDVNEMASTIAGVVHGQKKFDFSGLDISDYDWMKAAASYKRVFDKTMYL